MCGRIVVARDLDLLAGYFGARIDVALSESYEPSWNVAPTEPVVGLVADAGGGRLLAGFRWGFGGGRLFNARAETVATNGLFRDAFRSRRLGVIVDGFYEWQGGPGGARFPLFFARADGAPLVLAGLWEGDACTVVTTAAGPDVADVHDRMPAVVEPDALDSWLDPSARSTALLGPAPAGTLVRRAVNPAVGDVRNDGPELLEPAPEPLRLFP